MNTSQHPHTTPVPPEHVINPTFYNVCVMQELDYHQLQQIAKNAHVDEGVMNDMFLSVVVHRVDAEKILAAFSEYTGITWNLANVRVALLPTFKDICNAHKLDFPSLTTLADVSYVVLDKMLYSISVSVQEAKLVLELVSLATGQEYNLENVDIVLTANEPQTRV